MNQICHPKYKSSQYRHYMFDRDQSIIDKQRSRYEKQQQKRIEMHEISKKVGIRVFHTTCFGVLMRLTWQRICSKKSQDNLAQQSKQLSTGTGSCKDVEKEKKE